MRKVFCGFFILGLMLSTTGYCQETPLTDEEKTVLKENIEKLRGQSIVVQVLANQYNKELAELRRMEAVFCDVFKLDIDKWRAGQYVFNQEEGRFVLKPAEPAAAPAPVTAPAETK